MTDLVKTLQFRVAMQNDMQGALELLQSQHRDNLSDSEKQDGFISVRFTMETLNEMTDNGITVVAVADDITAGVLSAQSCDYNLRSIPLAAKLIEACHGLTFQNEDIELDRAIICGPVCVAKDFRGQGIFEKMYDVFKVEARDSYDLGLTLIARTNPRSLRAHEKIGYKNLISFDFDSRTYDALAMWF